MDLERPETTHYVEDRFHCAVQAPSSHAVWFPALLPHHGLSQSRASSSRFTAFEAVPRYPLRIAIGQKLSSESGAFLSAFSKKPNGHVGSCAHPLVVNPSPMEPSCRTWHQERGERPWTGRDALPV